MKKKDNLNMLIPNLPACAHSYACCEVFRVNSAVFVLFWAGIRAIDVFRKSKYELLLTFSIPSGWDFPYL
jgi:hypothetical protein